MPWISQFTVLLLSSLSGLALKTDSFSFDVSPMTIRECSARPVNNCGPISLDQSDCRHLKGVGTGRSAVRMETFNSAHNVSLERSRAPVVTFVTIHCRYPHSDNNATKQELLSQIVPIRKKSKSRAVKVDGLPCILFGNDTVGLISDQVVSLTLTDCTIDPHITSKLRSFVNMLQFTLKDCKVALIIHKSDFNTLQKIRIIIFDTSPIEYLEPETFTDLPELMTLALERNPFFEELGNAVFLSAQDRLHCDAGNDWIWEWLKHHPGLQKIRKRGEVYKVGSLGNEILECFATKRMDCNQNGKIIDRSYGCVRLVL